MYAGYRKKGFMSLWHETTCNPTKAINVATWKRNTVGTTGLVENEVR